MDRYQERFPRNNCQMNARWMVLLHPELSLIEGYLVFTTVDGEDLIAPSGVLFSVEHCWNETPDGEVVDSTAWAFEGGPPYRYQRDPEAWPRLAARIERLKGEIEGDQRR